MDEATRLRADYFRLMNANGAAHAYREAVRSGILDALAKAPASPAEVARACGTAERPTALLLDVLRAVGCLAVEGERYAVTPLASLLLAGGYRDLGDVYGAHLPALLSTDAPLFAMDEKAKSEGFYRAQAAGLAWMLAPAAERAAHLLGEGRNGLAVLDLGAGGASWSLALAARDAAATVTAVDWPAVLEVARASARTRGLEARFTAIPGDLHAVEIPSGRFDLAIVANVTHLETPEGNRDLLRRARAALRPGGRVAVIDVFPGNPAGDVNRTLYALGLALRTRQGRVYGQEEMEAILRDAGFGPARLLPLDVPPFAVAALVAQAP